MNVGFLLPPVLYGLVASVIILLSGGDKCVSALLVALGNSPRAFKRILRDPPLSY